MANASTTTIAPAGGIRFTVASRPQRRFSNTQTIDNTAATSFAPISLPATGYVRKIGLKFVQTTAYASAGAIVAGDGPWNLIAGITLTDATGQAIFQPISGYNLFLVNKYFGSGTIKQNVPRWETNPHMGPEFAFSSSSTVGTAVFRLDLDLEQDYDSGYGCIPNLDSNASLQLRVDAAASSVAFTGTTIGAISLALTVDQHYWAPVGMMTGGVVNRTAPIGFGDYLETRYETQTVTASAENTVPVNNRGGLVKGIIAISRAAGARVAFTAATNVGVVYDNNAIDEGIKLENVQDEMRRTHGYLGAAITTSYAPITAGQLSGIEAGVLVFNFATKSGSRDSWLSTRVGTLLQLKATPGTAATQLELVTQLAQVRDAEAFYEGGR
jgi:hypothetical protein